jgi:hypothetical protein
VSLATDNHSIEKAMTTHMIGTQADRGSAAMIATQRETAGGSANDNAAILGAADWVCLAAAPTFAIMALLTGVLGGPPDTFCSAAQDASALSGMVPMYMLMSVFHSAFWLKLLSSRRSGAHESIGIPPHL